MPRTDTTAQTTIGTTTGTPSGHTTSGPRGMPASMRSFADALLSSDLPALGADRRNETLDFIERRVAVLPSVTRFGVVVIASIVGATTRVVGTSRTIGVLTSKPLPLLAEYPRLIRSLGYAFVWETWPDTLPDGATR